MNIKTVREFFKQFPDDNACLDFLMKQHHGETLDLSAGNMGNFTVLNVTLLMNAHGADTKFIPWQKPSSIVHTRHFKNGFMRSICSQQRAMGFLPKSFNDNSAWRIQRRGAWDMKSENIWQGLMENIRLMASLKLTKPTSEANDLEEDAAAAHRTKPWCLECWNVAAKS